ncbi:hypothetical protein EDD18DRAFT_174457 [Armillaria luteobubalina]|uniref:Uncharacterized protein n=1 Tax=Armillaria luteobubalina TaxID=153913 RepID=A0AA39Q5P4_9AGAR|nr:hypothetical protein EDD18DRAFT_174457 [Armillaria luteobubalina]
MTQLVEANTELTKAKDAAEGAYALAARIRGREEEDKIRERDLEKRLREVQEQNKMSDLVMSEYADDVRSLDGRMTMSLHLPPATSLFEAKFGIHKLFNDFSLESEELHAEVDHLEGGLAIAPSTKQREGTRRIIRSNLRMLGMS